LTRPRERGGETRKTGIIRGGGQNEKKRCLEQREELTLEVLGVKKNRVRGSHRNNAQDKEAQHHAKTSKAAN